MNQIIALVSDMPELPPFAKIAIPFLGVLLITMGMLMGIRKRRRRAAGRTTPREQIQELSQKQAVRGDLEALMVEIEQLGKRFGAQLDAKAVQMEHLIDEADARIAELKELERAGQDAPQAQPPQGSPLKAQTLRAPQSPTPSPETPSPDDALKRSVCDLADQGHDPVEIARRLDEHVGKIELILALRKP